jgi:peptide/nickel transport system permease protein
LGLRDYIITRLILTLPMVLILLSMVFLLIRVLPGNPCLLRVEKFTNPQVIAVCTRTLGLDKPIYVQYADYFTGLLHGSLGLSMITFDPVASQIVSRFPATLELTMYAFVVAVVVGILLGSLGARKRGSAVDGTVKVTGILLYAFPVFFLGMIFQLIFGVYLHWLPTGGRLCAGCGVPSGLNIGPVHFQTGLYTIDSLLAGNLAEFSDAALHLVLPSITLGLVISGVFIRITRANMMETLRADYVVAARARGLSGRTVVYGYALRNALLPVVTVMGLQFALLLSGAILTETEFSIKGLGSYLVDRVTYLDYTAIQGTVVFLAFLIAFVALAVDVAYAYLDPRVRL